MTHHFSLTPYFKAVDHHSLLRKTGRVKQVIGHLIEAEGPPVQLGERCHIITAKGEKVLAEVIGFKEHIVLLMPLQPLSHLKSGAKIIAQGSPQTIGVGPGLKGRVLDPLGHPLDGLPPPVAHEHYPLSMQAPHPMQRQRISQPLSTGIKAIDGLLTCGQGQRLGIFSGSGVGKSTLLGMMARYSNADVNVIGLIGERGREVKDFLEKDLGPEGLKRSVVVVVTSDQPALLRIKGAFATTAIAEYFRDQGQKVLLMMDSVTRFAMAQREIGLAVGEPPATRGYTPSVYALLPQLLERSGNAQQGSITAFYTVLVEGDDHNEPIADTVRGILDGHIVLSRELAAKNHYPAIDVSQSISRLAMELSSPEHQDMAGEIRDLLATYENAEDLITIGAYVKGNSKHIDRAIETHEDLMDFLKQKIETPVPFENTLAQMKQILS